MAKVTVIDIPEDPESEVLARIKPVAFVGLDKMLHYLTSDGSNKHDLQLAKVGAAAVTAYTRHYASLTNRDGLRLSARRVAKELPDGAQ